MVNYFKIIEYTRNILKEFLNLNNHMYKKVIQLKLKI